VTQHPFIFNDTLLNNITLYRDYDPLLLNILDLLGLRELIESKGHKIFTENDKKFQVVRGRKLLLHVFFL